MELNGPTWSQKGTKREPKATNMESKAPKLVIYVEKGDQKAIKKFVKIDIQKRSAPGQKLHFGVGTPGHLFAGFMLKKGRFWEPVGGQNLIKLMKKTRRKSIPEN